MPEYKRKTLDQFPREFYKCHANPEGNEFRCAFCEEFLKTKACRLSHMKICSFQETGEDYDEENILDNDLTVGDYLHSLEIYNNLIRHFIVSNELESKSNQSSLQIQNYIQTKLTENGYLSDSLKRNSFLIYNFFFEVSEEELENIIETWVDEFIKYYYRSP
jgi:hypothetical protein